MGRKKRVWYPGAVYHVMSRGNRRAALYRDPADYIRFLECVQKVKGSRGFRIYSLCLMTNHFHMLIETEDTELWKIMREILHPYSKYFNNKYCLTGHVFESRYTGKLIEDERYFLEVSRYIHLNPVKAGMAMEPLGYEYSSYGCFVNDPVRGNVAGGTKVGTMIEGLVETGGVLDAFHHNVREQYRMFVEGKASHAEQEMLIQKDMKEDDMWLP